ncbi:hypothetical protein ABZ901_32930 [Actinacidiphila alni]|uniref:hypothetical protein n=1 Tax=Actinacidiphila alni TaxID=380248 RepID=UPI0033FF2D54
MDSGTMAAAAAAQDAPMTGHEPWLAHGLTAGDTAACSACGQRRRVHLQPRAKVIVAVTDVLREVIMICGACGRLLCHDCTVGDNPRLNECPHCRGPVVLPMI